VSAAGADHLGEHFVLYPGRYQPRPVQLAAIGGYQQPSRQTLLRWVEQLVDQILLGPDAAIHDIRHEQLRERRVVAERLDGRRLRNRNEGAFGNSGDRRDMHLVPGEALLAAEAAGLEEHDDGLPAARADHRRLDRAAADVIDEFSGIALGIDDLIAPVFHRRQCTVDPGREGLRM
jgi:hypothetical protein